MFVVAGIGWGMFTVSFFVGIYYNMIIAWTLYYIFASFSAEVPWANCDNEWNTPGNYINSDTSWFTPYPF
jgi:SNF family Na+-dependent transporter